MVPKVDVDGWRVYGRWAGKPKGTQEDPTRCVEEVCAGGRDMHFYQCLRKRGHGPDGLYCKQHDPEAVERRRQAILQEASAKYDQEMVVRQKQWLAEELGRLLMDAGYDTLEKVKALLEKNKA